MKIQLIVFLALLGVALSFDHNAIANINPVQLKALIDRQKGCIIYDGPCDAMGKMMKNHLPIMLRNCNIYGCSPATPQPIVEFFNKIQSVAPQEWQAVVQKYAH
ncbi:hypothetical protein PV327_000143 [Microctonus hyperodae]|uniref:Uncharacterized protein n=1 Tax=Microctonus hyperodae TaxID=165561 RepID=A0AA39G6K5_MICHY|nr:hypothetical protein PV327_000143 [Microctonus hyperodae]